MCYLVLERYSVCRCLYYQHSIDMCSAYGKENHLTQERTVLVGYACERHSNEQRRALWSEGYVEPNSVWVDQGQLTSSLITSFDEGVKITSATALRALEDARDLEEDDESTERYDDSVMGSETLSSRTTNEDHSSLESKFEAASSPTSNLDDLRARIRNPSEYIKSLQELEEDAWENSCIHLYTTSNSESVESHMYNKMEDPGDHVRHPIIPSNLQDIIPNRLSDDPFPQDPTNTSDEEITALCALASDRKSAAHLNSIRTCRNIVLGTFLNLKRLQQHNYCTGGFSIIVLDDRRSGVAKLLPIENTNFIALVYEMEYILRDSASLVLNTAKSKTSVNINGRLSFLRTPMIKQFRRLIPDYFENANIGVIDQLMTLVLMLNLAVASYASAHCTDFLSDRLNVEHITILRPFKEHPAMTEVVFQRSKFQCLDKFHDGKGVWAFGLRDQFTSTPLCLSTTIDSFCDVWGPLWRWNAENEPGKCHGYVVGGGSVLPWVHDSTNSPPLMIGETYCHWISNEETEDDVGAISHISTCRLDGTERLLIGAPTSSKPACPAAWISNTNCSVPVSKRRTQLLEAGRLCIVGASKPYHYNDSNQYQLQVGYSGVNASATRQYKRVQGQTFKDVFVELWAMEPDIRHPELLVDLYGIEVSMCTYNAQRVSLSQLLRLKCMHHLLRNFDWGDVGYSTEFFLTLADASRPKRQLDPEFRKKFDYAVMLGLKMLKKTGVDRENNLQAFLASTCTPKPEMATIPSQQHTWIGMLKDTTTECAMVAFGDDCLGLNYTGGMKCGGIWERSALRSAMIPHSSIYGEPSPKAALSTIGMTSANAKALSHISYGKTFSLGDRGILRVTDVLSDTLVMSWAARSMKIALKTRMKLEVMHREYTEIDHSGEDGSAQPLPIILMSAEGGQMDRRHKR